MDEANTFLHSFAVTGRMLNIKVHFLSGENNDPMIVECIYRLLNSCLAIFCNEQGTNHIALEDILMSLYAWNSAAIVGTDISQSLVVVGRESNFLIDYAVNCHCILTSTPVQ